MNKASLTSKIKKISSERNIEYNMVLLTYFMEEFLIRISMSPYRNSFIFKGGFVLVSVLGISLRTTLDMDISLTKCSLDENEIKKAIKTIVKSGGNSIITFELMEIVQIRENDEYGGFCAKLLGRFENIRQPFRIDFATGDPITPSAITYKYHLLIEDRTIAIKAYNLETILAEKLQTIIERGLMNSRSKDFYDIYMIWKTKSTDLDTKLLSEAIECTFKYRRTICSYEELQNILKDIETSGILKKRWNQYSKTHPYANNILFEEVIFQIHKLLGIIERSVAIIVED